MQKLCVTKVVLCSGIQDSC